MENIATDYPTIYTNISVMACLEILLQSIMKPKSIPGRNFWVLELTVRKEKRIQTYYYSVDKIIKRKRN